jgi:hypothetical protein
MASKRRQMPWRPYSPYYTWFSGMITLYLACAGSVLGFLLSRQVFYTYMDMDYTFPTSANTTYVDMVRFVVQIALLHDAHARADTTVRDAKFSRYVSPQLVVL